MVFISKRLWILVALIIGIAHTAPAQSRFSIAYRVNTAVITYYDIDQRVKLLRALGVQDPNLRQNAIEALINDRIKQETADRAGMTIEQAALARSISEYAAQRNMTTASLMSRLRRAGVAQESFEEFLSTSVLWNSILRARFGSQASPSEIELNAQLNSYAISSSQTIQIGEIVLPYMERGQDATVALAERIISRLKAGENFSNLAKEYSRSRTAEQGGVIGWVAPNRLPAQIGAAVRGLGRGAVADPIYIPSGIVIIKVLDARTISQQIAVPVSVNVTYAKLVIPYSAGGSAEALRLANRTRRGLDGCRGLQARAAQFGEGSGVFGPVSLNAIDAGIGLNLARLAPRDSTVMQGENALNVLVLCDRVSEMSLEGRNVLRRQLLNRNLNALSEGYLLELRRNSIIEKK